MWRVVMRVLLILLLILPFLFFFQSYPNYTNANELSRFLLTAAIVDDHSFQIDNGLKRFGPCQDISRYKDHFYSNKAIGYSLVAVPFYFAITRVLQINDYDVLIYLLRLFVNLIPLLFFSALLLRWLQKDLDAGNFSYALLAAFLYCTLIFPYTQVFASHMITGLLWFTSLYLIVFCKTKVLAFLSGALLGISFLMEIPSALIIPVFLVWVAIYKRPMLAHFTLGCALLSLPAFAYNLFVFDGLLHWPYIYVYSPELVGVHSHGYVGEHLPSLSVLGRLLLGTNRGFFYYQPLLAFGIAGFISSWKRRPEIPLIVSTIVVSLLFYSGYEVWDGGWCFGPRFLVPLVPLLFYGCAVLFREGKTRGVSAPLFLALAGWTLANMLMGASTFLLTPRFLTHILEWQVPTLFWNGFFGFNWGDVLGFSDATIRTVFIAMSGCAVAVLLWRARLRPGQLAAFIIASTIVLFGSGLLQPWIQARMPAAHSVAIGRTGYIQGHYAKALPYLYRGRENSANSGIRREADSWISAITAKITNQ